jgi:hypothetical protein
MGETAHRPTRGAIRATASLRVDPERLERMLAMSPADRLAAAQRGEFTLGEMLRWASRQPHEVDLVDGEFWFITALSADAAAAAESTGYAQGFCEGEYTPLPDTRDVSRAMPAAAGEATQARRLAQTRGRS